PSATDEEAHLVPPDSPFSLRSVLQFGLLFLVLQVAGTLAERALGSAGFYVVSVVGGLVSSASSVASAARLQNAGAISASVAGTGVVLTTLTSLIVNQLLFSRLSGDRGLTRRLVWVTGSIVLIGIAGVGVQVLIQDMLGFLA
ncbi:MAG TPA: magnesium transporter accessory protein, partial [Chloroflexi bacterium]|nr:magnesium transporter accessory protein [Chloroflexota bacterium]